MFTAEIIREKDVRWISDGKYYSSGSTASGLDMALGVISDLVDLEVAIRIEDSIGYEWDQETEY